MGLVQPAASSQAGCEAGSYVRVEFMSYIPDPLLGRKCGFSEYKHAAKVLEKTVNALRRMFVHANTL